MTTVGKRGTLARVWPRTWLPVLAALTGLVTLFSGGETAWAFDVTDIPPQASRAHPSFEVNSASHIGPSGVEVVLAFRVPFVELYFDEREDEAGSVEFVAEFDVTMLLYDGKRQIGGDLWNETVRTDSERSSNSRKRWHERIVRIPAEAGHLRAEVTIRERISGRANKLIWDVEVPRYEKESVSVSSLWVTECDDGFEQAPSFPPQPWNLKTRFGEPLGDLCIVGEVYREGSGPFELKWKVLGPRQDTFVEQTLTMTGTGEIPFLIQPDLSSLWLGSYVFEVEVKADGKKARRRFEFQMDETMVSLANDLEQSLQLIRLIGTKEEVSRLRDAPANAREVAWEEFWRDRDPTPGTSDNEFKEEFFDRVRYANDQFAVLEAGWKSDRGRIFIKYGMPDDIESRPSQLDGLPVEIWTYERQSLRFVFVDYDGFGRYELYQPGRS